MGEAHHKAIGSVSGNGVTSRADWDAVNAALGRVFASVPESTVMDVYNSVSSITDSGVPAYLKAGASGADAAYSAFLEFKDASSPTRCPALLEVRARRAAMPSALRRRSCPMRRTPSSRESTGTPTCTLSLAWRDRPEGL